jgi:hypothetical protein
LLICYNQGLWRTNGGLGNTSSSTTRSFSSTSYTRQISVRQNTSHSEWAGQLVKNHHLTQIPIDESHAPISPVDFRARWKVQLSLTVGKGEPPLSNLPEGWTDDMNIAVAASRSLEELVEYILQSTVRRDAKATMLQHLSNEFGLNPADAELALDRAYGGVVRAATGQTANCPIRTKTR